MLFVCKKGGNMAIKNSYEIYIDGRSQTYGAVMPLKLGEFLDEQLDEATVSLRGVKRSNFAPLTPVEIRLKNKLYWSEEDDGETREKTYYFIVADDNAEEMPPHSGLYNHELYLMEVTKAAERVIVDSLTYTNTMGKVYTSNQKSALIVNFTNGNGRYQGWSTKFESGAPLAEPYKTPVNAKDVSPLPISAVMDKLPVLTIVTRHDGIGTNYERGFGESNNRYIYKAEDYIERKTVTKDSGGPSGTVISSFKNFENGQHYVVEYVSTSKFIEISYYGTTITGTTEELVYASVKAYDFVCVENKLPLKQSTITDVINRLFDVCEPIHKNEKPRFRLNAAQASLFDTIIAPQLSFTKQTLRECMQEIGKVIHGEPRLTPKKESSGWYYEVSFELYGGMQNGRLNTGYTKQEVKQSINSYCSYIDSNAENIVNQLDRFSGVITEPYVSGYKTVRTESMYTRIEEGNMIIATQQPIYSVEKLECGIVPGNESITYTDITAWLFEKSMYDAQLSSYDNGYPLSKKYGLYFTQGQKNIQGLSFKAPDPIDSSRESYAIVNILRNATGNNKLDISSQNQDYIKLAFRVTYTPFYNSRITQSKAYYKDVPRSSGLVYNQQSNIIETHYYGENLKGVIARMGNIEKTVTYLLSNINHIPKAGQLYDKNYYISVVSSEILPTCIKCTIGLSKDFNRLSEFIGISSVKRYSEVSESQAQERNPIYRNYVVIGKAEGSADAELIGSEFMQSIRDTFKPSLSNKRISNVVAWGEQKGGGKTDAIQLPVISSAFGNSISFSWQYEDNYSAGAVAQYGVDGKVSGYFQNNATYCDFFGRIYYYHFALQYDGEKVSGFSTQTTIGTLLPKYTESVTSVTGVIKTPSNSPFILRKDSREILQVNAQIDFVTNDNDLIIGSALAAYNPLIRGADKAAVGQVAVSTESFSSGRTYIGANNISPYEFGKEYFVIINGKEYPLTLDSEADGANDDYYFQISGYSSYSGTTEVYGTGTREAKLYVFDQPLNKFVDNIHGAIANLNLDSIPNTSINVTVSGSRVILSAGTFPANGKSWAIISSAREITEKVEDEDGKETQQSIVYGGNVLLAKNMKVVQGAAFETIYFTPKREVFDKSVWKDIV